MLIYKHHDIHLCISRMCHLYRRKKEKNSTLIISLFLENRHHMKQIKFLLV